MCVLVAQKSNGRIRLLAAFALVWAMTSCGARETSVAGLSVDGASADATSRSTLFMKLSDSPESASQPNAYRIWLAAGSELTPQTVRICVGDVTACRLPTAIFITTIATPANGKTFYVSSQAITLSENMLLTSVAQIASGGQIIQKTARVSMATSSEQPVGPPTPVPGPQVPTPVADTDCYKGEPLVCEVEKLIVEYTNVYRKTSGLGPVKHHAKIAFVARDWSTKQAAKGSIGHDGFGQGWRQEIYKSEFGSMGTLFLSAENVAMSGYALSDAPSIAKQFTDMWWNSPGHKANMVGRHTYLGSGVSKTARGSWYATQIFGNER